MFISSIPLSLPRAPANFAAQTPPIHMATRRPRTRTASVSTVETAWGTHSFKIAGYSRHTGVGVGKRIFSATFTVGGHDWRIIYYPDGETRQDFSGGWTAIYLELMSRAIEVRARYEFTLVNPGTGLSSPSSSSSQTMILTAGRPSCGPSMFVKKSELGIDSVYLYNDCVVIECVVTVIQEPRVQEEPFITSDYLDIQVPPSDLSDNLGKLLASGEGADVKFKVGGEVFRAHKSVLATRSPVFKAQFYGPMMRDSTVENIPIEEIEPTVFGALLHFIYTDLFPEMGDLDWDEQEDMVKDLLVAADRYAMERLKLVCQSILCKKLDVESVTDALRLAEKHHCSKLKDACIGFIISSSKTMVDVLATDGYGRLKKSYPAVAVEMWEKAARFRTFPRAWRS